MTTRAIAGVQVTFPYPPYPNQLLLVNRLVKACQLSENAVLESPTGTGKTMALLCGALAWLRSHRNDGSGVEDDKEEIEKQQQKQQQQQQHEQELEQDGETKEAQSKNNYIDSANNDDNDFVSLKDDQKRALKRLRTQPLPMQAKKKKKKKMSSNTDFDDSTEKNSKTKVDFNYTTKTSEKKRKKKNKRVRIFYTTRTHSQLHKVIEELRKSGDYYHPTMSVIASRQHYCINSSVKNTSIGGSVDSGCLALLGGEIGEFSETYQGGSHEGCLYVERRLSLCSQPSLYPPQGPQRVWDIEDLVFLGKKVRGCPYYAAKYLAQHADIVFCPYTYLFNPNIRKSMNINIEDAVVIVDEAHNIEDVCREASSLEIPIAYLQEVVSELQELNTELHTYLHVLIKIITTLTKWMEIASQKSSHRPYHADDDDANTNAVVPRDREGWKCTGKRGRGELFQKWSGEIFYRFLNECGLCCDNHKSVAKEWEYAWQYISQSEQHQFELMSPPLKSFLNHFCVLLGFFLDSKDNYRDYSLVLRKSTSPAESLSYEVCLWCFNPAIGFHSVSKLARTVLLTSGTLSPLDVIASELNTVFPHRMQCSHVIDIKKQLHVSCVSSSSSNVKLHNTFIKFQDEQYQVDELGDTLFNFCQVIPEGVLCFFPSYSLLSKLLQRWNDTGLLSKLLTRKKVVVEPRLSTGEELHHILDEYKTAIYETTQNNNNYSNKTNSTGKHDDNQNGALLLAVCRGKVAEGLDFSDSHSRGVLVVGIPYPSLLDLKVKMKREYNDKKKKLFDATNKYKISSHGIISGDKWYNLQAFRAVNQALGRCIRHKEDYGTVVLLDDRYERDSSYVLLAPWIRPAIHRKKTTSQSLKDIHQFFSKFNNENLQ